MSEKLTVGVVVPAQGEDMSSRYARPEGIASAQAPAQRPGLCGIVATLGGTHLFVDDEAYSDVVAVEFSCKHLLLCIPVRAGHDAVVKQLTVASRFNVVIDVGSNPGCTVVSQRFDDFRFDRINYRCCTHHFVAAPTTDRPSGIWIAELRFVAPLQIAHSDAKEKAV